MVSHQVIKERPYSCEMCSTGFVDANGLKRHHRFVHDKERTVCPECGTDLSAASLGTHMNFMHKGKGYQKENCHNCGKTLNKSKMKKGNSIPIQPLMEIDVTDFFETFRDSYPI